MLNPNDLEKLKKICNLVRYGILISTTEAGSGHPTSALSAVELTVPLFFGPPAGGFMNGSDKFILSKGHASPLLYSLYFAKGLITEDELLTLRKFDSPLEGHPTPRFPYVDVATGSLGQGLSIGLGMALGIKQKVYILLGDSEVAEGQIWEAAELASYHNVDNLVAILDVNRLGQRGETMLGWDLDKYKKRFEAFGWKTIVIDDGHDLEKVYDAFNSLTRKPVNSPTMIIAKTIKGKGVPLLEDKNGWHGKALDKDQLQEALAELGEIIKPPTVVSNQQSVISKTEVKLNTENRILGTYQIGDLVATREAYGDALVELGKINSKIVALDAEVSNSTMSEKFQKAYPDRFFEMFIAEQNMVSTAVGLSKVGFIPFVSTFAAFFTRAFDQIRMSQYSKANIKLTGSHAGVSIGSDGPSQMALEDLSMMRSILESTIFYPSDAISAFKLTQIMAGNDGLFYLRTTREKTPVIYSNDEEFEIGGSKILRQNDNDKAVIFAAGITVHEALKAHEELNKEGVNIAVVDLYSIKPIDGKTVQQLSNKVKNVIVVEDHYPTGGLGESVLSALQSSSFQPQNQVSSSQFPASRFVHLAVNKIPRSGTPQELLAYEQIDSKAIIKAVKSFRNIQ